jgi:hypothetical protein
VEDECTFATVLIYRPNFTHVAPKVVSVMKYSERCGVPLDPLSLS